MEGTPRWLRCSPKNKEKIGTKRAMSGQVPEGEDAHEWAKHNTVTAQELGDNLNCDCPLSTIPTKKDDREGVVSP